LTEVSYYSSHLSELIAILEEIGIAAIFSKHCHNIIGATSHAISIIECNGLEALKQFACHNFLEQKEACSLTSRVTPSRPHTVRKVAFKTQSGVEKQLHLRCFYSLKLGLNVTILKDISKEVMLLNHVAIAKKELEAKSILLQHKEEKNNLAQQQFTAFWDHFPGGLAAIDSDLTVTRTNNFFAGFSKNDARKCFELLGLSAQCPSCPLSQTTQSFNSTVIGHRLTACNLSEIFIPTQNHPGALLIFKDITKEVGLIEKIRQHLATIQQQKDILADLAELMTAMQKTSNPEKVAQSFLSYLNKWGLIDQAFLIIEGGRKGHLNLMETYQVPENILTDTIDYYLRQRPEKGKVILIPNDRMPLLPAVDGQEREWEQVFFWADDFQIGVMAFTPEINAEKHAMFKLFYEPLRTFFNNIHLSSRLKEMANKDGLTGLYNKYYFENALSQEKEKANRYGIPFSLIVMDANGLKKANDTFGHLAGDALIKGIAHAVTQTCRADDVAARIGGDEFCVLLPNAGSSTCKSLAERIANNVNGHRLELQQGITLILSISIGYASSDTTSVEVVLEEADKKMYADKQKFYQEQKA